MISRHRLVSLCALVAFSMVAQIGMAANILRFQAPVQQGAQSRMAQMHQVKIPSEPYIDYGPWLVVSEQCHFGVMANTTTVTESCTGTSQRKVTPYLKDSLGNLTPNGAAHFETIRKSNQIAFRSGYVAPLIMVSHTASGTSWYGAQVGGFGTVGMLAQPQMVGFGFSRLAGDPGYASFLSLSHIQDVDHWESISQQLHSVHLLSQSGQRLYSFKLDEAAHYDPQTQIGGYRMTPIDAETNLYDDFQKLGNREFKLLVVYEYSE